MRYTVRYRDTLGTIAYRFGVSVDAIMRVNGLRHYYIHPGQVLWIPIHHPQYGHYPYYPGQQHGGQQHPYYHGQQHGGQQHPYYPGQQHGGQQHPYYPGQQHR